MEGREDKVSIQPGDIVQAPWWNEPVKVLVIEEMGTRVSIKGVGIESKNFMDDVLTPDRWSQLKVIKEEINFSADGEEVFLLIEALRFKYASLFDPLLAMHVSKVDPLPFQIEAVYGYVLKQPLIRFLIADDPGAGKTIMAGLILKELKLRGLVKRVLIVCPGHLRDQWRRELKEKFDESFEVMDRNVFNNYYGENPWKRNMQVITSMDFAKQKEIRESLEEVNWDLAIVDEAHKMSAFEYGKKCYKTERYQLGEVISKTSNHLLFLTATPHRGDPSNFRHFLDLLKPGFFATNEMIEESLRSKDNPLFIRRLKEDLKDFQGRPIFTKRFPKTIKFHLTDKERSLYNNVSRYVEGQYRKAKEMDFEEESGKKKNRRRNVTFALMILQRRMASSIYALLKSLKRRKARLEEILNGKQVLNNKLHSVNDYLDDLDDEEEELRWKKEEEWETLTFARDDRELHEEIHTLDQLIQQANRIIEKGEEGGETKLSALRKAIEEGFRQIEEIHGNPKILIFTESKDTLDYLVEKIRSWGYKVNFIHGGMKMEERIREEKRFRDETDIMVATEAAGEGINLQFCHVMINYDIPWNPNRLEQRMGRIHRYGQQKDVYIFNLVAEDTIEGRVLSKLFDKLEEIRAKLGSDRVFDVIGEIFEGKKFADLILEALTKARDIDEILKELDIDLNNEEGLSKVKEILGESLATRFIDHTRIKEIAERAEENRLIPKFVEEFFKEAFQKLNGKIKELGNGILAIDSIPTEVWNIADSIEFKNQYGIVKKRYPKVTFDKEIAFKHPKVEFISFGHPLFEALLELVIEKYRQKVKVGAVFKDPKGNLDGYIWFYIGKVRDGKGETAGRKILAIYDDGKNMEAVNPTILGDLTPVYQKENLENKVLNENEASIKAVELVEKYEQEILKERKRQAEIKRKYGLKSLDYLIRNLDQELVELYERKEKGEKMNLIIRSKEERKKRYERDRKELEKEIRQEENLVMEKPAFLTVIRVIPAKAKMVEDEEIERIGMEYVMEYERRKGREPEDVSKQNLGFDIRSRQPDGNYRYIEVKARAYEGEIFLTRNEQLKAQNLGDKYYLYVVFNAAVKPELHIIQNPAENLESQEVVEIKGYTVPLGEVKRKGKGEEDA